METFSQGLFSVVTAAVALFAVVGFSGTRWRPEIVALISCLTLAIVAGASGATAYLRESPAILIHPAPLTVGGMLVISAAIERMGLLTWVEGRLTWLTRLPPRLGVAVFFLGVGGLSAVMNNTPLVATGIPVARRLAKGWGIASRKVLMPLAFAANAGGVCLLVGTSTNLVVAGILERSLGLQLGMWTLLPIGLPLLLGGALLLYFDGFRRLPEVDGETMEGGAQPVAMEPMVARRRVVWAVAAGGGLLFLGFWWDFPLVWMVWALVGVLILTGVSSVPTVLRSVRWEILLIIWTMMSVGGAIEASGLADALARFVFGAFEGETHGRWSALLLLVMVVLITSLLTEMISNNATAALVTPLVLSFATKLQLPLEPFALAICVSASACFASPVGYQTNTMVYRAGQYSLRDFLVVGLRFNLLYAVATPLLLWFYYF
jgi:di/tricarboxylate transporter